MYTVVWTVVLAAYSLSAFVNNLFPKKKWSHYIIIVCCIGIVVFSLFSDKYLPIFAYALVIFSSSEAIVLMILAMIKKIPGSKILGAGILCFFLFLFIIILGVSLSMPHLQVKSVLGLTLILLGVATIFSIPVSISFYLAWSYSNTNKDLGRQLKQVEQLSRKSLQQEQEKQQLLEGRKEELEKEVALRTMEVMHQKEQIEQQHDALKTEKKKSDDLLLNILPAEVANELKEKGEAEAKMFDHVSVLFTDFVNFTQMSERMSPQQLVAQLHENFKAFDEIMERNGLEKIKTIGDAYLAVSGMPVANERHAYNAVKAGLEIVAFIRDQHLDSRFEVRVGIHSGPLVAGIVGVKKFAYDIWGDTVNTASRMESSGEAGKVNVSESTYELVKNDFTFIHRGKIDAKHKGAIDMYFVEG
jgi:class 3 adenylate cyclase